jgi:hypothetical protein
MRRLLSLFAVGLMVAACGGIGAPGFTIPPINIPSLPPFQLPSGGINIPGTSVDPSAFCRVITPAEVGTIMGATPSITEGTVESCTYTFPNFSTIVVSTSANQDLQTSKFLFGNSAKDITVNGLPAVSGSFIGQPAVHVQRGTDQLQVLGILTGADEATINKLVQIATIAGSRW